MSEHESSAQERAFVFAKTRDPGLEAIEDEIAELVAEALFNRLVKHGRIPSPNEPKKPWPDEPH